MFTLDFGIEFEPPTDSGLPFSTNPVFKICGEVQKVIEAEEGNFDSSGCGYGVRDMQFRFDTELKAKAAEKKVREVFKKHNIKIKTTASYIKVYENEEYDEEDLEEFLEKQANGN